MDKKQRGKALIINLKDFSHKTMIEKSRKGTDVDRDRLKDLWQWLGFQVTVYNDDDDIDDGEVQFSILFSLYTHCKNTLSYKACQLTIN